MASSTKKINKTHLDSNRALSSDQLAILELAIIDPFFFANFIYLVHPIRGKVRFDLYDYQKAVLKAFLENRFNIILKFRQAGITEMISMFCLWFAMYHPNKNVVIISIKDRIAKKVLKKIKFMYKNLPDYLRVKVINGRSTDIGTASELEFANGSLISSIPTTEEAGRSEGVSLLVIDEAAIVRWAEKIWAAAFPTLSTGGRAILNSTAYGVGNLFHKTFVKAVAGGSEFFPIRLKWQMHPERYRFEGDMEWYNQQAEILGPRKTAQEIDGDFLTSGNTVFDLGDIRDIEDAIADITPVQVKENGLLKIWENPKPGEHYYIGADIATGRSNDFSAFSIMDKYGDEKVSFKGKVNIDKMTKMLAFYGKKYNRALIAPESNDIGLGVAMNLQNNGYTRLYYSQTLLRKKGESRTETQEIPGWYTTKKNRPIIIAELEEDIRDNTCNIKDKFFCDEAYTFIYDSRNRPIAMNKDKKGEDFLDDEAYTDDAIFAKAITNFIRKKPFKKTTLPQ